MQQFTDNAGRLWSLRLNFKTAQDVQAQTGANLLDPACLTEYKGAQIPVIDLLIYDDLYLGQVVAAMLKEQIKQQAITPEQFAESIDGETFKNVEKAFFNEYRFFFAERGKKWLVAAVEKDLKTRDEKAQQTEQALVGETLPELPGAPESAQVSAS